MPHTWLCKAFCWRRCVTYRTTAPVYLTTTHFDVCHWLVSISYSDEWILRKRVKDFFVIIGMVQYLVISNILRILIAFGWCCYTYSLYLSLNMTYLWSICHCQSILLITCLLIGIANIYLWVSLTYKLPAATHCDLGEYNRPSVCLPLL